LIISLACPNHLTEQVIIIIIIIITTINKNKTTHNNNNGSTVGYTACYFTQITVGALTLSLPS